MDNKPPPPHPSNSVPGVQIESECECVLPCLNVVLPPQVGTSNCTRYKCRDCDLYYTKSVPFAVIECPCGAGLCTINYYGGGYGDVTCFYTCHKKKEFGGCDYYVPNGFTDFEAWSAQIPMFEDPVAGDNTVREADQ